MSQTKDHEAQKDNLIKQTENKIKNLKAMVANLEDDTQYLKEENKILEKEKVFKIDNLKHQINSLLADKKIYCLKMTI